MVLYLELWKPRDGWRALSQEARDAFVAGIGPAIAELTAAGVELVGFAKNDTDTEHRADYVYLAAWRMPSRELALALERAVTDYGFHDHFEQVNARGEIVAPDAVLADMAKA
jgi:hypothetical protein